MVSSAATNVEQYIAELPEGRREVVSTLRELIRRHLPKGYVESMTWGMICYTIPLADYPHTYNGHALCYVSLAAQKNYCSLYLLGLYASKEPVTELQAGFKAAGKKLDMGKCCVRFKSLDDLALEALGKSIADMPPARYIELYEAGRARTKTASKKPAAKKAAATRA